MQLTFVPQLLHNVRQFATIENEKLPPNLSEEDVVSTMQARAEKSRALMAETNALIEQYLNPVFAQPEALSDEEADAFAGLAFQLSDPHEPLDIGLAYPLHEALLRRAQARDDIDRIILHLYHCGYINLTWDVRLFTDDAIALYRQAVSYMDRYFTLESKETRRTLNRCLGNLYVAISGLRSRGPKPDYTDFFEAIDRAVAFWSDPKVRALDPDFPWEAFINNSHQNITAWMDKLREGLGEDEYLARRVYESTQVIYGVDVMHATVDKSLWPNARMVYAVSAAKYHAGMISAREMTENMRQLFGEARMDDYSADGLFRMLYVSGYLYEYLQRIPGIPQAVVRAEERVIRERVHAYCRALPESASRKSLNRASTAFMSGLITNQDPEEGINLLLELTTFNHLPTHVHSIMTSRLMEAIAAHFIDTEPERLAGIFEGIDTARAVQARKQDILARVRLCGLAHDAGKFIFIRTFSLYSRKLTDREFRIVREHTGEGYRMLYKLTSQDACIADVICGHHKTYDGKGGYPADFDNTASPYRFIIDIASVADSIDAATDNIGRSYANQKTLLSVVAEIVQGAGTRYNPDIARALEDSTLQSRINDILLRQRRKAYYSVYQSVQTRTDERTVESG